MDSVKQEQSELLKYVGIFLLGGGVLVAGAIVSEVFTFFTQPADNVLVQYLTTELSKTDFARLNENPIVLGESGAFAVAVFLFAMLVWSVSAVSYHVINAGLSILMRTYTAELSRLKSYVSDLAAKFKDGYSNK